MSDITTVGLDLAKNVFQVHAGRRGGQRVLRRRLRRSQVLTFFAELPPCLIGLEASATRSVRRLYIRRPSMRFVPLKAAEQQSALMMHRARVAPIRAFFPDRRPAVVENVPNFFRHSRGGRRGRAARE
jgi:transposase